MGASPRPSDAALTAFGIDLSDAAVAPERLTGGRGLTWRAGSIVLRPSGADDETAWKAEALAVLPPGAGFRTARPIRSDKQAWAVDGWEAWEWLAGQPDESRVAEIVLAGAAFHQALAHLPRPHFLDTADDPWARADRIAWEEQPAPPNEALRRLHAAFAPVAEPSQMIHGDLLGNVMFEEHEAPAIIDWAPYWRPAAWGGAIALADAACWHGLSVERMCSLAGGLPEGRQLLIRALSFRIATVELLGHWGDEMAARHEPVIAAALR